MSFRPIRGRFVDPRQSHEYLGRIWAQVKPWLEARNGPLRVEIKEETRTSEQNALFHALCGDIARHGLIWAGKPRDATQIKLLLVSGHAHATKEGAEIVTGLEGELINLRESTALMSKRRGASLIEYTLAWMAQAGIRPSASDQNSQEGTSVTHCDAL